MKRLFLCLSLITIVFTINATQVSGNQSGTWLAANNPYEVVGDVVVPTGTTLTVQPGVIVQAMGNYQITAQGNIIAIGTVQDSIYFVSGQSVPTALWKGIRLENTSVQSQFSYCRIDLGDYGINSINSPVSITYCHFKNNKRGIQAYGIGSTNPAQVLIGSNLIELSVQNGILIVQNSNTTVTNNAITRNGTSASYYGAIQLSNQSAGGSNSPLIAYNHIHHNYKQGIIAWDIVSANAINPEVHHNLVENNLTGIYFRHASGYLHHNTVRNNFIPGDMNSGAGFMISGSTAQPYLEDNIVTGNYTGFYLTENANPILGDLAIYHAWAQGGNQISNNIDANNVMHSIYCYNYTNSNITIKAENNFWDYNTAPQIAGTIEDHNDNTALPTIDFTPWQNNPIPIYLAGTFASNNPLITQVYLQLVSAHTGNILNYWTIDCNAPFQVPVYHDSLVYIIASSFNMEQPHYMAAYGSLMSPIPVQIIADVQFDIGTLTLTNQLPNWSKRKVGVPEMVNGHQSYPLMKSWYVYAPFEKLWLFRDGNYLKISRYSVISDTGFFENYDINPPVIWRKIASCGFNETWQQYRGFDLGSNTPMVGTVVCHPDITYFEEGMPLYYTMFNISGGGLANKIVTYDIFTQKWTAYEISDNYKVNGMEEEVPAVNQTDGTLFPLITNNSWTCSPVQPVTGPSYFGYNWWDSLHLYWIPLRESTNFLSYRIYRDYELLAELPLSQLTYSTTPIIDGMVHIYQLSAWDGVNEQFATNQIYIVLGNNSDEVIVPDKLSIYPNPFNPAAAALTFKFDSVGANRSKLAVYNVKGQLVWSVTPPKGVKEISWDGRDKQGRNCAAGLYQVKLTDNQGKSVIRKIMLIR